MTGLKPRVDRLEAAINPPEKADIAGIMQSVQKRQDQQRQWRKDQQWQLLDADLCNQIQGDLEDARQSHRILCSKRKLSSSQQSMLLLSFQCLLDTMKNLQSCRNHELTTRSGDTDTDWLAQFDRYKNPDKQKTLMGQAEAMLQARTMKEPDE